MVAATSLIVGVLGISLLFSGALAFRVRNLFPDAVPLDLRDQARRGTRFGMIALSLVGLFFALASVLVWWNWPLALIIGGMPIVAFGAMLISGRVDVITRLSSGSDDSNPSHS